MNAHILTRVPVHASHQPAIPLRKSFSDMESSSRVVPHTTQPSSSASGMHTASQHDPDNPFTADDGWGADATTDSDSAVPLGSVQRQLAIALGEAYDPSSAGRVPWRTLPRAFTTSDCGCSPLRRSITAYPDGANSVRLVVSEYGASDLSAPTLPMLKPHTLPGK